MYCIVSKNFSSLCRQCKKLLNKNRKQKMGSNTKKGIEVIIQNKKFKTIRYSDASSNGEKTPDLWTFRTHKVK